MRTFASWNRAGQVGMVMAVCTAAALAAVAAGQTSTRQDPKDNRPDTKTPGASSAGVVDLRPKFKAGQQLRYVMDMDSRGVVKSGEDKDMDQTQSSQQKIVLVMKVKQAGDDGATIGIVYESIKMTMDTPDGKADYDSSKATSKNKTPGKGTTPGTGKPSQTKPTGANPGKGRGGTTNPSNPASPATSAPGGLPAGMPSADASMDDMLAQILGPMVGQEMEVKTDRDGKIISVSGGVSPMAGLGSLGGGLGGGVGAMDPKATAGWLVSGLKSGNNGTARVGESWTNDDELGNTPVGAFRMKTTHTLRSASGSTATVGFTGQAEPGSESSLLPGMGGMAQLRSSKYGGTYQWDTKEGALREMDTQMSVVMDAKIGESSMSMTNDTRVKVKRQ